MQHIKGRRSLWVIVAIIIIALVAGLLVQRMTLTQQPSSYQDRLNRIESQGYSPQQAAWIATANLTVLNSNSTYADTMVNVPTNVTAEVIIDIKPNQILTPTQSEIDNNTLGIYNMTFSYGNTSTGHELNVSYFLANSSLSSTATVVTAAVLFGSFGQNALANLDIYPSLPRGPGTTLLNGGSSLNHKVFHVLEEIKMVENSVKAVREAVDINKEYTDWLKQLNELQDCAENPTNPLTISGYQQDPGQEKQILDQIASAKAQLAELTIARFVNLVVGLGSELVKNLHLDAAAVLAELYSEGTLKQLSEEEVQSIEKLVTPCSPTTTTSTSQTTSFTTTFTSSTTMSTTSGSVIAGTIYGAFSWRN